MTDIEEISVILIDDHRLVRDGLQMMLDRQSQIKVVGICEDGKQALDMIRDIKPDVAIMDISMPEMDGITVTRLVSESGVSTRILILTMHQKPQYIREVMDAGAFGFLTKNTDYEELITAINTVAKGEFYLHPSIASLAFKEFISTTRQGSNALSDRERDVVRLIAQGKSVSEVANTLFISVRTVQTHLYNAMKKLNLHSQRELIFYIIREGIVDPMSYS